MAVLSARQSEILEGLNRIKVNFGKDPLSRKTSEYIQKRIESLDNLWGEFEQNHLKLSEFPDREPQYFASNFYQQGKSLYQSTRSLLAAFGSDEKGTQSIPEATELLSQQRTNFRAFNRSVSSINVDEIAEKWELEDELRAIQAKWNTIDTLHLRIDHILQGGDITYENEFSMYERSFKDMKRTLNKKISSMVHIQQATPKLEIPTFTGKYTHWPTFCDLFTEAIHDNNTITKAQKMQHLKGKIKGEAERLIQHLHISSENYDTAWEILNHRYNNAQVLFTNQIEIFLNQPSISKQTAYELKRLYDTTTECIHAIHNLGVNTNTWDPLLVHLLSKKLDQETYCDYKEARTSPRELPSLTEFMTFLENKFTALEPLHRRERETTKPSFKRESGQLRDKPANHGNYYKKHYQVVATQGPDCPICNKHHPLVRCWKFSKMTPGDKLTLVTKSQYCKNCLYYHPDSECNSTKRCKKCNSEHNTFLHDACVPHQQVAATTCATTQPSPAQHNVNHVAADNEEVLLTTLSLTVLSENGTYVTLRALLDQGSQISLISENATQMLGLQRRQYHASISGVGPASKQSKGIVTLNCMSIYGDYTLKTQALVVSKVISSLPNSSFRKQNWSHLQHLQLADPEYNVSRPIDLLLDASVYSEIILSGLIKGPAQAPIAQQTKMGWILSGNVKRFNCHVAINNIEEIAKFWELEDIHDSSSSNGTIGDQFCEDFYKTTTRRLDNGMYEVGIPMMPGYEQQLGSSKFKAIAQFKQLETKMSKNTSFSKHYKQFMNEYQELGHMRQVESTTDQAYYLPHHGVWKLDSTTTKLRVVFNASSKTTSGNSLNDLMYSGPNLQQDLLALIINWRQYQYVITADIEKMFRQILVREQDQPLQTIIWRDSMVDQLNLYQLTTVTYGTKAAPFLAMRTLKQLAADDAEKYPLAAAAVQNSFYMDDLLSGQNTADQAKELQLQLIKMLQGAGMNLRKWSSNAPELLQHLTTDQLNSPYEFKCLESRKTLGLKWNPSSDTFMFQSHVIPKSNAVITKRKLLSEVSKLFDPLGWLSPLTIRAKLLFQQTWSIKTNWDQELPKEMQEYWLKLKEDINCIDKFRIPRFLGNAGKTCQLHAFCDASDKAYACVIYLVTKKTKGEYTSTIVAAKTKLAPVAKKTSLPRLELCGALLLSQLVRKVIESLPNIGMTLHAWTDSMIVLGWLHGDTCRWKSFVANRVKQITNIVPAEFWSHVSSEENAADCATRGITSHQLLNQSLWWEGPEWLKGCERKDAVKIVYQSPPIETKAVCVNTTLVKKNVTFITELLQNYSSLTRIVRITSWVSRFIKRIRNKQIATYGFLKSSEINNAYNLIIKEVQSQAFQQELQDIKCTQHVSSKSKICSLNPWLDENGLLRVGGRLKHASISALAKHPIILPSHSRLTDLVISQAHITTLHGGPRLSLSYIRDKYWIISGIRTVKRQLRLCVKCRRFNNEVQQQIMADLPRARVTPSRPFTHTGVDFTGHVELKANKGRGIKTTKGYVAVFVCLSTKAVHLELVSDLSTAAFLAAFRRFCSRRGSPGHMYSDNGTNFVGANRLVKQTADCMGSQYDSVILQLEHEVKELEHYQKLLENPNTRRQKRGLINGVGYLANTLFGVLDENFAQQYKQDIERITNNENHLQRLLKNQTLVLESEYNILRRSEETMNKQFKFLKQLLQNVTDEINKVRLENRNGIYVTSSALAASIILSNLMRIQHTLIDTVTDISHGHIDPYLLTPEQLARQINIISGQLQGNLMTPIESSNLPELYKIMRASATLYEGYLIIEIKIPLVSNDIFELDRVIPIPQKRGSNHVRTVPSSPYIAYNIQKDLALLLSDSDLQACFHIISNNRLLCTIDKPLYNLGIKQSLCDIQTVSNLSACKQEVSTCHNYWIKLHNLNSWFYTCCESCELRIACIADTTTTVIRGSGIIDLGYGCTLKSDSYSIHTHNNYLRYLNMRSKIEVPEVSILNTLINTTLPNDFDVPENHTHMWNQLRDQITNIKEQSSTQLNVHDIHHYSVVYVTLALVLILGGICVSLIIKSKCRTAPAPQQREMLEVRVLEGERAPGAETQADPTAPGSTECVRETVSVISEFSEISKGVNKGTSPMVAY